MSITEQLTKRTMQVRIRIAVVVIFAVAMAWMESATVVYLRTLVGRVEPYQQSPLPIISSFGVVEVIREAATLLMLMSAGWLAGISWKSRLGCFMAAFGVWDIFYYVFLKIIVGWPHSLYDWDVLFLIPLPWWGPVLSPILISLVLVLFGTVLMLSEFDGWIFRPSTLSWGFHFCGIVLALYAFMENSIEILLKGGNLHSKLPTEFNWPLFVLGFIFLLAPIIGTAEQVFHGRKSDDAVE